MEIYAHSPSPNTLPPYPHPPKQNSYIYRHRHRISPNRHQIPLLRPSIKFAPLIIYLLPPYEFRKLYIWGRDEGEGRLGLGPGHGPDFAGGLSTPSLVKAMLGPVAAVSCGGFFTMALTEGGQLWNWGANSNYELGRGYKIGGWKPQPVASLQDVKLVQIAGGGFHSLALTDKGEVLSWGHGGHGQLGNSSLHSRKVLEPVEALANENVTYIACQGSSSAVVTEKGKLYMWGNSANNQLGIPGLPDYQLSPVEVKFLSDDDGLGDQKVLVIAVGASHAMCLVSRSNR